MNDLIINLAPTGMIPTRAMSALVPITPAEIIEDACRCVALGASILHIHARDEDGRPTHSREIHARIIGGIRERHPEAIICVSLSGRDVPELEKRADPLFLEGDLKPDMGSLTLSSLNFTGTASINAPDTVRGLARIMRDRGILPELEAFDAGMLNYAGYLIEKGDLDPGGYVNLLLGNITSAQLEPAHFAALKTSLPAGAVWAVGGLGRSQLRANMLGILYADGVRVGLEDDLWLDEARTRPASNPALVERIIAQAEIFGRKPADPVRVRERLGLER